MILIVPHVDIVKASLGDAAIQALLLVFSESSGIPPGTHDARFRADHPAMMDVLDKLGWAGFFLKKDHAKNTYRVSGYALPLIDSPHAAQLLECMSAVYVHLQAYYDKHLKEPLPARELINSSGSNSELALEALCYMYDIDGWSSGSSHEFPTDANSTVIVNEQVLVYHSFADLVAQTYEWNYVNPKHKANAASNSFPQRVEGESPGFFNGASASQYPAWYDKLDPKMKELLKEIDVNIRNNLLALPMMGLRALLDNVLVDLVGDVGTFEAKLVRFEQKDYVTKQRADTLRKVLEAGHASMHRLYIPSIEELRTCEDVVKHLLQELYVLHSKVEDMAANIPPRLKSKN